MHRKNSNEFIVKIIEAWLKIGTNYMLNFAFNKMQVMTVAILEEQWKNKTYDECELDVLECSERVRLKRRRTERDVYVSVMGRDILRRKKSMQLAISSYRFAAEDEKILAVSDFVALDTVVCRTFDVMTGDIVAFPVLDWLRDRHFR